MIQFWLPFFWSSCWSLQQTSWPFFVVSILGVDCPFSGMISVPVCPTLIPLSVGHVSTGSDCQSLTILPSCLGLFRLNVGSPLVVCTAPVHRAHLCGSRKRESPLLTQEGLALGLTPVCGSPAVLQGWDQCCVLLGLFLSVKQDRLAPVVGQLCSPVN